MSLKNVIPRTRARLSWLNDVARRTAVERIYRASPAPIERGAKKVLLVEGMWDNPNHWFRLWMFLHAYLGRTKADVVGILRSRRNWDDWRKQRSLEALGVRRFVYLDEAGDDCADQADEILSGARTHRDMLELRLPDNLPAYVVFDTVLKYACHPQPPIEGNLVWKRTLAETLQFAETYRELFDGMNVVGVVSSHAWKNEWACLCWTALRQNIPFFYLTGHYDSIRIRRMRSSADYRAPNEHLTFGEFTQLPAGVQESLVLRGERYLRERFSGNSDFIVLRYSIRPEQRSQSRGSLLASLGLDPGKPIAVIYAHSWFDFPHTQAMANFDEPLDWLKFTLQQIRELTHVNWVIKPHPCDRWYDAIRLRDMVSELPSHVAMIPEESDSLAFQTIADAVVTIQGSVAIEAAAMGKIVVCADRGVYSEWGFTNFAKSRAEYASLLRNIVDLPRTTPEQSQHAMAYAATALAPPPHEANSLTLTCDTRFLEGTLYPAVRKTLVDERPAVMQEILRIREWLATSYDSYNAWRTLSHYLATEHRVAV